MYNPEFFRCGMFREQLHFYTVPLLGSLSKRR